MQAWLIAIIVIAAVLIIAVTAIGIVYLIRNEGYVTRSEVISSFNKTSYNTDGSPKGGILVSLFDNLDVCPDYEYTVSTKGKNSCKLDASDCTTDGAIVNPGDITQILTTVKQQGAGTNCFALDTTYLRRDMPQYLFGPYSGGDMTVGIIIDPTVIFDYIACMFPIDSGSVIRYNPNCVDDNIQNYINDASEVGKNNAWKDYIQSSDSVALGSAGCGTTDGNGLTNFDSASGYFMWTNEWANDQLKTIKNLSTKDLDYNSWAVTDDNKPFDKYQWDKWSEAVKNIYSQVSSDGYNFIYAQMLGNDGYRENEVDIYIPNESGVDCTDTDQGVCNVTEAFKSVFAKALIGVVSVAEDNASTAPSISSKGPGGFGCVDGKTCENSGMSESCGKNNDVYSCLTESTSSSTSSPSPSSTSTNNCCYDSDSGNCYKASNTDTKCCSSTELSESLAKNLADNWNSSNYRTKYGGRKVRAYKMRVQNIYNFDYTLGEEKNLNLQEIK